MSGYDPWSSGPRAEAFYVPLFERCWLGRAVLMFLISRCDGSVLYALRMAWKHTV